MPVIMCELNRQFSYHLLFDRTKNENLPQQIDEAFTSLTTLNSGGSRGAPLIFRPLETSLPPYLRIRMKAPPPPHPPPPCYLKVWIRHWNW